MAGIRTEHPFSLTCGGPFYHLLKRCHLVDTEGCIRWAWIVAIVWIPLVPMILGELAFADEVDAILRDPTMHIRLLVTVPLLFAAERLLERRCATAVTHIREEGIADRGSFEAIIDKAEHLRDSRFVECAIALVVLVLGQAALWELWGWRGIIGGVAREVHISVATVWCFGLALPAVQFLMLRWLWRWALWTYVLARLSQLELSLNALHPDRAAGLRPVAGPTEAFALNLAACTSVAAAAWSTQIVDHRTTLQALTTPFMGFVVVAVVVGCGPLLLFSNKLYRARHRDTSDFHALAREYVDAFRDKWLGRLERDVLGARDLQALNDLGGALDKAESTRLVPFGARTIINLWAGAFTPMIPPLFLTTPVPQVATKLAKMLFGIAP